MWITRNYRSTLGIFLIIQDIVTRQREKKIRIKPQLSVLLWRWFLYIYMVNRFWSSDQVIGIIWSLWLLPTCKGSINLSEQQQSHIRFYFIIFNYEFSQRVLNLVKLDFLLENYKNVVNSWYETQEKSHTILTFSVFGTTPAFFLWERERNQFKGTFAVGR